MDMILKNTFQSISPAYELIGDVTVGTATTQVDFNGLNIGKDDELLLVSNYIDAVSSGLGLSCNGNNTSTNYDIQRMLVNSTTITAYRVNDYGFIGGASGQKHFANTKIKLTNSGYFVFQTEQNMTYSSGSTMQIYTTYGTSRFTSTSITSLTIKGSTNTIGTGSRFQLYKLVAEKVADIIVPSNTTSVNIAGLNIGKDGEYYLVSDVVNSTVTNSNYAIIFNENHVETNYWHQQLYAASNSYSATRSNQFISIYCAANNKTLCSTNIKLTNSGYGIQQNSNVSLYGGSLVEIIKRYVTTTFTASTISHIRIASYVANAIGANSRFTLYRMK